MPLTTAAEAIQSKWEILVFGSPGAGKTTLFADVPNVLFICVDDNGWIVLRRHPAAERINLFHTRSWAELAQFAVALPKSNLIKSVDTIVVDTISECQQLERLKQIGGNPLTEERWLFNQHLFSVNNFKIMSLVRELKKCGKNIVWLCHSTVEVLGEGKNAVQLIRPALSPTLLATVQANVDGQYYLDKPGGNRILYTDDSGEVQTKNRFRPSRPITNPTWDKLEKLIYG